MAWKKTIGIENYRRTQIMQTIALLTLSRILRRVLETWEDLLSF